MLGYKASAKEDEHNVEKYQDMQYRHTVVQLNQKQNLNIACL